MSGREWKPGAVAIDPQYGPVSIVPYGAGCNASHEGRGLHTHLGDGDWNGLPDRLRPLVVIDPEDREQVERLWVAMLNVNRANAQAALREFANPTPPPKCPATLVYGGERFDCEREPNHDSDHRNDRIGQGVRWSA